MLEIFKRKKHDRDVKIHVTRNGELYVEAAEVVRSKLFREQIKKMATIQVERKPRKHNCCS